MTQSMGAGGESMACATEPSHLSRRTRSGSSFSKQLLEEDLGFEPGCWRVNTAAQDWAHRESILSHIPTFLFTVLAMVRWEKPQCHVFSMNCNSMQWAEFPSAEVSVVEQKPLSWQHLCLTTNNSWRHQGTSRRPQTAPDKAVKSYSSCTPTASSTAVCWGKPSAGIQSCKNGLRWALELKDVSRQSRDCRRSRGMQLGVLGFHNTVTRAGTLLVLAHPDTHATAVKH